MLPTLFPDCYVAAFENLWESGRGKITCQAAVLQKVQLRGSLSVNMFPRPQYPLNFIAFSHNPQAPAAYESHSEQFSSIVPQLHCSVHYEYTATQDSASAASQSPQRDTSSVNQYL